MGLFRKPKPCRVAELQGKIAIIAYGNPSRGDDALGPLMYERLQSAQSNGEISNTVSLFTDFQLQIEHILDFKGVDCVIFVDAALHEPEAFSCKKITARSDQTFSTHALSPQALLAVYESVLGLASPPAYVLAIQAIRFELGNSLSDIAMENLKFAESYLKSRLRLDPFEA